MLHLLNRFSLWEWLGYLMHRNWAAARQVGRQSARTFVIGGQPAQHWLYFADDAYRRFFSAAFVAARVRTVSARCGRRTQCGVSLRRWSLLWNGSTFGWAACR